MAVGKSSSISWNEKKPLYSFTYFRAMPKFICLALAKVKDDPKIKHGLKRELRKAKRKTHFCIQTRLIYNTWAANPMKMWKGAGNGNHQKLFDKVQCHCSF